MIILTIRTDRPEAEIGLYDDEKELAYQNWQAHRQLAETIHAKIREVLDSQHKTLADIEGIVAYKGPGSFTGLRIGLSVANALAHSLEIPITGSSDDDWQLEAINKLLAGKNDGIVIPEYGAEPHITTPKR